MRIRYMVAMVVGWKLGMVLLCLSLFYVHRIRSESYFNVTSTADEQWQAVKEAPDRDIVNDEGLTGLMFAAVNGQLELAKALVTYGADLNSQSPRERQTALHYATNNMRSVGSMNVGYYLVDAYANTMLRNRYGQVPLHLVISTDVLDDRTRMVEYLIKNGSDMNVQTAQGDTLMHLAVNLKNVDWVGTLLGAWATIIDLGVKNKAGLTPYGYAVKLGFETVGELLKKEWPKITTAGGRDSNGLTGLMLAVIKRDARAVAEMVKDAKAIDMTSDDRYGVSALQMAIVHENEEAVRLVVGAGANVMVKNKSGDVAVHYLVRVGDRAKQRKIAEILLKKNPHAISAQNNEGNTVVHLCVQYNDEPLLQYMVEKYRGEVERAVETKNNALETPIDLAGKLHRVKLSPILHGASSLHGKNNKKRTSIAPKAS